MPSGSARKKIVIFIVGPTAIGKTRLAIKLSKRIKGEIISADSMQVYKYMRILSQAPDASGKKAVRHYLTGSLDPRKEYNVALFRDKASEIIDSLGRRGIMPVVVGGSGLYVRALVDGLFPSEAADPGFRKKMYAFASRYGSAKLHRKLSAIDPRAAELIHPNDARRIIRALEIHRSAGRTMTELKKSTRGLKDKYDIRIFGLTRPRAEIYYDIEKRVDRMFDAGVIGEVKKLSGKRLSRTAKAVLGYKEIAGYLKGKCGLEAAKDEMKVNTRHFAKRQLSWFRPDKRIRWFDVSKMSEKKIIDRIMKEIK